MAAKPRNRAARRRRRRTSPTRRTLSAYRLRSHSTKALIKAKEMEARQSGERSRQATKKQIDAYQADCGHFRH